MRTARSLTVLGGCLSRVVPREGCAMWPIPSCIWCYLYTVPAPTETEEQCSCLYSGGHVTWQGMMGYPPSWTEFLTYACENITFPQLLLRAVKTKIQILGFPCSSCTFRNPDASKSYIENRLTVMIQSHSA